MMTTFYRIMQCSYTFHNFYGAAFRQWKTKPAIKNQKQSKTYQCKIIFYIFLYFCIIELLYFCVIEFLCYGIFELLCYCIIVNGIGSY